MGGDHLAKLIPLACAGFGLLLAGGVNLLLIRRRVAVRFVATLAALGLGLGAAAAVEQPNVVADTGRILALGMLPCLVLGSRRLVEGVAGLIALMHRSAVRYSLLTVAGVVTIIGGITYTSWLDQKESDSALAEMELAHGKVPSIPAPQHKATTNRGTTIVMKEPAEIRDEHSLSLSEGRILSSLHENDHVIRRGPASDRSNCHGWVFTGGRFILGPDDVELILKENGYEEVFEPHVGDLVIYRQNKAISHSAIIRYVTEGHPVLVEGKWGAMGVFLHPADKCIYGNDYTFYRSPRSGHLLAGLGGPAVTEPAGMKPIMTE